MKVAAIDVYCGCGGATRGLLDAGIDVRVGVDVEPSLKDTYEQNNAPAKFIARDVTEVSGSELLEHAGPKDWDALILVGCAPCQPFSRLRGAMNRRARLIYHFGRLVDETRPDAVLLENVPGLARTRGMRRWRRFVMKLRKLGYAVNQSFLDAKDYGVPQTRRRIVLLAGKGFMPGLCLPTHGPKSRQAAEYVTVRDAIGGYHPISAGETSAVVPNHRAAGLSPLNLARIKLVPKNGGSRTAWPPEYVVCCHSRTGGFIDTYGRMRWDRPAPTLTTRCTSISNGRFGHPSQDRAISVREAAALQTFPDSYVFPDSIHKPTIWIGNAVPAKFACVLGNVLLEALRAKAATPRQQFLAPIVLIHS